eukprot:12377378-Alexandrium_andersonii.AAC.1
MLADIPNGAGQTWPSSLEALWPSSARRNASRQARQAWPSVKDAGSLGWRTEAAAAPGQNKKHTHAETGP